MKRSWTCAIAIAILACGNCFAVHQYAWTGIISSEWGLAGNWSYYDLGFSPAHEAPAEDAEFVAIIADTTIFHGGVVVNQPTITSGTTATSTTTYVGYGPTGQATLNIQENATLNTAHLSVGMSMYDGNGDFVGGGDAIVNLGGNLTSSENIAIGNGAASRGVINVANSGSLTAEGIISETGSLNVSGNAHSNGDFITRTSGTITVNSGGTISSEVNLISYGGAITVNSGGTLNSGAGILAGNGAETTGLININGTATTNSWDTIAGWEGADGTINIGETGSLSTKSLIAGAYDDSIGTINIAGIVNLEHNMYAGLHGTNSKGTINIANGADVRVAGNIEIAHGDTENGFSDGEINMDGGVLRGLGLVAGMYEFTDPDWNPIGGFSQINLNDGEIWVDGISGFQANANIDIEDGVLYILGDVTAAMDWYVSLDALTAFDGTGEVVIDLTDIDGTQYTRISAIPEPATFTIIALGSLLLTIKKR